ncbi:hypothetical protein Hypma_008057 [Hypsizygus marmoreus]|uniref:Uncharacterized protein n=1 Tax=Hypsizygus marmoreus TaxID=39966 RepID=A0A369JXN7_HYPMA|nr:hypothetical protein Hypma_008057 [Hypsizygus marmoreus]
MKPPCERFERVVLGAWGWLNDARTRTEHFNRNGPSGPATWVLTQGRNIPQGAIEVSDGLYICRAYHEGGRQIGKASPRLKKGAAIGYKHDEIDVETYEILLGDMSGLRWVPARGKVNVSSLGHRPVEGGNEDDGSPLYVVQALYKGTVYPGKASEKLDGAYIPYDGTEKNVKEYRVLCYN